MLRLCYENIVDNPLGNLNFRSNKLANGVKRTAIKKAKNSGDNIVCPKITKYPSVIIHISTEAVLDTKGNLIFFTINKKDEKHIICFPSSFLSYYFIN